MANAWNAVVDFFENAGWKIVTFLSVLAVGIVIIRLLNLILKKALLKSPLEHTLSGFIRAILQFVLWLLLLLVLCYVAEIPITPLITALGAVGLAFSLAIKDSLSNLANGLVLLGTKPFKVGDYVDIDEVSGTIKAIKLMTTELLTFDNKKVLLPNGKVTSAAITNYSAKPNRRVEWDLPIAYGTDVTLLRKTVLKILNTHPKVLALPAPVLRFGGYGESSLKFSARAWVLNDDFWDVFWEIGEKMYDAFNKNGIVVPFNQLDVYLKNPTPNSNAISVLKIENDTEFKKSENGIGTKTKENLTEEK